MLQVKSLLMFLLRMGQVILYDVNLNTNTIDLHIHILLQ